MPIPVKVLLADDADVIRRAVRNILESDPDVHVVGEVSDLRALAPAVNKEAPDIVVLDLNLGRDAEATIKALKEQHPKLRIVIITAFAERKHGMVEVDGFLDKISLAEQLLPLVKSLGKA